jgi:hypothetical protein
MIERLRISIARNVGPIFWPAWYIAPQWKLDKWHKIACELPIEDCPTCARYYGLNEEGDPHAVGSPPHP